jgi:4,5-dihydroxyphthalate decarboxylase
MEFSLALDRYDRHFPFFDGTVTPPPGVKIKAFQVGQSIPFRDGKSRHERMLHNWEFDICEFSMSTYLMALDRKMPITALPVFPRRLFSSGLFYVSENSPCRTLSDLTGRRVALHAFQTTLSLLARGDLKFEYGVPWETIEWFVLKEEKVPFDPKSGVKITKLSHDTDLGHLLENGVVDAVIIPQPPRSITSGRVKVRRLVENPEEEELRYFRKYGYFPIMHILAVNKEFADREPWLGKAIMEMFAQARQISASYYEDPNWSSMLWARRQFEREREILGIDPWPMGIEANRKNLEWLITYSKDQGLIRNDLTVDALFADWVR